MNRASLLVLTAAFALPVAAATTFAGPSTLVSFPDTKETTAEGVVKSVDAKANSFVITVGTGKDAKDVTVKVTKDTKYTLDGKESTLEKAAAVGNHAKVTHTNNTASKVEATSKK